eukprot:SAG31_NODE_3456_length_4251_cov_3.651734_1_plen_57_part_00
MRLVDGQACRLDDPTRPAAQSGDDDGTAGLSCLSWLLLLACTESGGAVGRPRRGDW